jgi:hypothetical protein
MTAGFQDFDMAVKAGGALLDHGVTKEQFGLLAGRAHEKRFIKGARLSALEEKVESGITTTTGADAAKGADEGAGVGAVLGALAGLASLFIPGYGVVVGGGALPTAVTAAVGTAVGGAAAGGVTGYLKDLGVDEKAAQDLDQTARNDGVIVVVQLYSDGTPEAEIRAILEKYNAIHISSSERIVV